MKFTEKTISLLEQFITALNQVEDKIELLEDVEDVDSTNSAEVEITYTLESGEVVKVDKDMKVSYKESNEAVIEGNYLLSTGDTMEVDSESKLIKVAETLEVIEEVVVADIAQEEVIEAPEKVTIKIDDIEYETIKEIKDYIYRLEQAVSKQEETVLELQAQLPTTEVVKAQVKPEGNSANNIVSFLNS